MYSVYGWYDENNTYHSFQLPSFASIHNRITNIEKSIESLLTGRGSISTDDNNRFHVTIKTVPTAPDNMSYLDDPKMFFTDPNWIFEDFMFPAAKVRITLTGQVNNTCKQVHYRRIIVNSNSAEAQLLWNNRLRDYRYTYPELINVLADNNINFYEDVQTVELPHSRNTYWGVFQIMDDPTYENGMTWYTVDTLNYSTIDVNGTDQGSNNTLQVGNELTYNGALFEIIDIRPDTLQIRLKCTNGVAIPGNGSMLHYYNDISISKYVDIRFGAHEYNFIYLKAVEPVNNILSNAWSQCVKFDSDELSYMDNTDINFSSYYENNIFDWGAQLLAEVKERKIPAALGVKPNIPSLNASDFKVVQINSHINTQLGKNELRSKLSEIESAKSHIDSINQTIKQLRSELTTAASVNEYKALQDNIKLNLTNLETAEQSYSTLAKSVSTNTQLNKSLLIVEPKYRVRGFFPIPEDVYYDSAKTHPQTVIGFDISYRYLSSNKENNTLERYEYTDSDGSIIDGVFSNWNIIQSKLKERVYNSETDTYEWKEEQTNDASTVNINQIDIPIQAGECVEFKIRSITEAGYPENPVKSEWSNSVIIEFPDELKGTDTLEDTITNIQTDINRIEFRDVLNQDGLLSHINDQIIASDGTGTNFGHTSKNIGYEDISGDGVRVISLQNKMQSIDNRVQSLFNTQDALNTAISKIKSTVLAMQKKLISVSVLQAAVSADSTDYDDINKEIQDTIDQVIGDGVDSNIDDITGGSRSESDEDSNNGGLTESGSDNSTGGSTGGNTGGGSGGGGATGGGYIEGGDWTFDKWGGSIHIGGTGAATEGMYNGGMPGILEGEDYVGNTQSGATGSMNALSSGSGAHTLSKVSTVTQSQRTSTGVVLLDKLQSLAASLNNSKVSDKINSAQLVSGVKTVGTITSSIYNDNYTPNVMHTSNITFTDEDFESLQNQVNSLITAVTKNSKNVKAITEKVEKVEQNITDLKSQMNDIQSSLATILEKIS